MKAERSLRQNEVIFTIRGRCTAEQLKALVRTHAPHALDVQRAWLPSDGAATLRQLRRLGVDVRGARRNPTYWSSELAGWVRAGAHRLRNAAKVSRNRT
ncbi:hypothetical protein [Deinococcus multiflagellatus]|uniref:Transposase n=1 Tax=Deinococcus multiflagellatus TaxID=1656887 RepID=A0ABW1ZPI1_9DEIO|nr:hypothetical protein [Deinococcus multiflagellatus]MBZ9715584.1 hypothetical protein [Deinococcus multiflagellatus]